MAEAQNRGLQRMKQPGLGNKAAGAVHYLEGSIPFIGPGLEKASTQYESGDISGGTGTTLGIAAQTFGPKALEGLKEAPRPVATQPSTAPQPVTATPKAGVIAPESKLNAVIQPHASEPTAALAQEAHPMIAAEVARQGVDLSAEPKPVQKVADLTQDALDARHAEFHQLLDPHADAVGAFPNMPAGIRNKYVRAFRASDPELADGIKTGDVTLGDLDRMRVEGNQMTQSYWNGNSPYSPSDLKALTWANGAIARTLYSRMEELNGLPEGSISDLQSERGSLLEFNKLIQRAATNEAKLSAPFEAGIKTPETTGSQFGKTAGWYLGKTAGTGLGYEVAGPPGGFAGYMLGGRLGSAALERLLGRFGKPVGKLADLQGAMRDAFSADVLQNATQRETLTPRAPAGLLGTGTPQLSDMASISNVADYPQPRTYAPPPTAATTRAQRLGLLLPERSGGPFQLPASSTEEPMQVLRANSQAQIDLRTGQPRTMYLTSGEPQTGPLTGSSPGNAARARFQAVQRASTPTPDFSDLGGRVVQPAPASSQPPTFTTRANAGPSIFETGPRTGPTKIEAGSQISGAAGKGTSIKLDAGELAARYRIVEASDLKPSHDPMTFAQNPDYPAGVQERAYHTSKEAQARVIQQAQSYDPDYTVNTNPDAVNGPPVVTQNGTVLGGNSRAMSTARLYAHGDPTAYVRALQERASQFGIEPAAISKFRQPVLVREVSTPGTVSNAARIGSELNRSKTGALSPSEQAVSAGKQVSDGTLQAISRMASDLGDSATLRDVMRQNGQQIISRLGFDGAIPERQRPQFVDTATGGLSEQGKDFVEKMIRGRLVDDPALLDRIPKGVMGKLDSSLSDLASLGARNDGYNILPAIKEALKAHAEMAERGLTVDDYLNQQGMFGAGRAPEVDSLIRTLSQKPSQVRQAIKQFTQDARADVQGQGSLSLGGPQMSPQDAFRAAFESSPEELRGATGSLFTNGPMGISPARALFEKSQAGEQQNVGPSTGPFGKSPAQQLFERRQNFDLRKIVAGMTPEERSAAAVRSFTSKVTGLPNGEAFDLAQKQQPAPFVATSDSDGLGAVNDKFGHDAGDALLKAKANALQEAGLDAYHVHGDEFQYRGNSAEELQQKLERARQILRDEIIEVTKPDGSVTYLEGADFSYGVGQNMNEAESGLMQHKASRSQGMNLGRKQFGGIREVGAR
jgi:GGDEF domain-containing protein